MKLTEALALSDQIRRHGWSKNVYWLFNNKDMVFTIPGTEIRHTHISVESLVALDWEPYTETESKKPELKLV